MTGRSLRRQLFGWVLAPLALLAALNATASWFSARDAADLVTDRTLLASARSIAEQARVEDGDVQAPVPPAALEMFDTGAGDFVYYAVATTDGRLVAGVAALAELGAANRAAREVTVRGRTLRALTLEHPLVGSDPATAVAVTVGVSLRSRDALLRHMWLVGLGQQAALIAAAGLFMAFGLRRGLAPLLRLRDMVLARPASSLDPLDPGAVQVELQPLVVAINRQTERVRLQMAAQHRFVVNAAHQLRTPLALLNVQAAYALRRQGSEDLLEALESIQGSTQRLSRLAGQLLTLSRAEPGSRRPRAETIALGALAARVLDGFVELALDRGIDLGLDDRCPVAAIGDATMLGEALSNLVDNALRYCPRGSRVTVSTTGRDGFAVLAVEDDGPGVPAAELDRLFERFYRVPGATGDGSGLGLAIVKEVAEAAQGAVASAPAAAGGLVIEIILPAAAVAEAAPATLAPGSRKLAES